MTDFKIDVATAVERADPGASSGAVQVYTKDIAGITHAYAVTGNGVVHALTPLTLPNGGVPGSALNSLITVGPRTGLNQAAAQNVFNLSTITLTAGMPYKMRGHYAIIFAGTTATLSMSLLFGGTASYTSFQYMVEAVRTTATPANVSTSQLWVQSAAAAICTESNTNPLAIFRFDGIIAVNTSGTFIPQFLCSATPTQVPTVQDSSYIELIPLGAGFTSQGGWG